MAAAFIIFAFSLFVDGATDAANSVTGAVSSGAVSIGRGVKLCAFFEFLGCIVFCSFFPGVAERSSGVADIPSEYFAAAVVASLAAVSLWSAVAWVLGLPTSEGHGLSAALAGAGTALSCPIDLPKLAFIAFSAIFVVLLTGAFSFALARKIKRIPFKNPSRFIIALSLLSSVFHGAQDGQKFLAVFMSTGASAYVDIPLVIFAMAVFMSSGTLFCGRRIILHVGEKALDGDACSSFCAGMASVFSLLFFTILAVPASTTHVKMTALCAAVSARGQRADKRELFLMAVAWIATFPVCFAASFLLTKGAFAIFL